MKTKMKIIDNYKDSDDNIYPRAYLHQAKDIHHPIDY